MKKKTEELCELCSGRINGLARQLNTMVVCQDCYDSEYEEQVIEDD